MKVGWKIVKFGDVVRQCKESVDRANNQFERYVEGGHMDSENIHVRRWGEFGEDYVGPAFHRIFRKGQVLYGSRRTYLKKVAMAEFDGITANTTFVCETKDQNVFMQELLPFLMLTDVFTEHSIRESKGSTNPYINWSDIAKFEFPLPPLEEQKRIAEILWAADKAVEKWNNVIQELRQLLVVLSYKNFLLHEARRQKPSLPLNWRIGSINEIVEIDPRQPHDIDDDLDVSFVAMEDVSESGGLLNKSTKKYHDVKKGYTYFGEGDILFAKITPCMENNKGALVGNLTNGIGMGSTEFFIFRPKKKTDQQFVYYLTMSRPYRKRAERWMQGSAGQRRVPKDFFIKRPIVIPHEQERKQIGIIFKTIDDRIIDTIHHLELIHNKRKMLLHTLFSDNSEVIK
jgi:type I restriction enzyme, S subunit